MTTKAIGSPKARAQVKRITASLLKRTKGLSVVDAAADLSLSIDDIRNMRAGQTSKGKIGAKFSVAMLFKMVRDGKFDPGSILAAEQPLRKHRRPTKGGRVSQSQLDTRISDLAWNYPGKDLAKLTGLSVTGAYGLRYARGAHVTLYTMLGLINSKQVSVDYLVFGKA